MEIKNEKSLQDEQLAAVSGGYTPEPGDWQDYRPCRYCGSMPIWVHDCGIDPLAPWRYECWCDACGKAWNER